VFFFKTNEESHRQWKKKTKKTFEDETEKNELKRRGGPIKSSLTF
jgi:hypothetical protein